MTRNAIKTKEKEVAKNAKTNSKTFWRYINSKTKLRACIPDLFKTPDYEKAGVIGMYFSSVFVNEPDSIWEMNEEDKPHIKEELYIDISKEIIHKKLVGLNINKSPGPVCLHPRIFKELANALVEPLYMIYNLSLKSGKIPSSWKSASISAIYKGKGNKHSAENYRPVSLTSIACKIMESIMKDSMLSYLKSNEILSTKQIGFLAGR